MKVKNCVWSAEREVGATMVTVYALLDGRAFSYQWPLTDEDVRRDGAAYYLRGYAMKFESWTRDYG